MEDRLLSKRLAYKSTICDNCGETVKSNEDGASSCSCGNAWFHLARERGADEEESMLKDSGYLPG